MVRITLETTGRGAGLFRIALWVSLTPGQPRSRHSRDGSGHRHPKRAYA
jgi:hypothetical protein